MIKHLFTLIWNRRRSNALMILEVFFSFVVLFAVSCLLFYLWHNYRQPMGFSSGQVSVMLVDKRETPPQKARETLQLLVQQMKAQPEVEYVGFGGNNYPYSGSTWQTGFKHYNQDVQAYTFDTDDDFANVMGFTLTEGRWFNETDRDTIQRAIVITQELKEKMFGDSAAVGRVIMHNKDKQTGRKIVGVVQAYRYQGELSSSQGSIFNRIVLADTSTSAPNALYLKLKPSVTAQDEEKLVKAAKAVAKDWDLSVLQLAKVRTSYLRSTLAPTAAMLFVAGFLIINVALGVFGVLWYNINRRNSEIGLRRALGATANQIRKQFVGEVLVIATFGLLLGLLLAAQFPLLGVWQIAEGIYWQAIGFSMVLIFLLVILCALYPSWQAAKIQPAMALHEE